MALTNDDLLAIGQLLDTKMKSVLQTELQPIKDEIQEVKEDLGGVKQDLEGVKQDLEGVKQDLRNVKLHLENVTDRNIQLLVENYVPAAKRFEEKSGQIETMQEDIVIMKKVIADHSEKLQQLA